MSITIEKEFPHFDARVVGILRTATGTSEENTIRAIDIARECGVSEIEITTNSDDWQEVVGHYAGEDDQIGVGSVKDDNLADKAHKAGAKFLVCPNYNPEAVECAMNLGIPIMPTAYSLSDIAQANEDGLPDVKVFPACAETDLQLFQAIASPFRDELEELKAKGWKVYARGTYEFGSEIETPGKIGQCYFVNSPSDFYSFYLTVRDKELNEVKPFSCIVFACPDGVKGVDKLDQLSKFASNFGIRTYATGIPTRNDIQRVFENGAYGAGTSGMFHTEAIKDGNFDAVETRIREWMEVIRSILEPVEV